MATGLAALRLLVIDDNPQMRTIVGTVLRGGGVRHICYAQNGYRGLEAVEQFRPDVCYVDYEMPVMNGLEFISKLRAPGGQFRCMPVIMLTGHSDYQRITEARDRGVTEFLCKPVTAITILKRLESVIFQPRPFIDAPGYFGPDRRRVRDHGHNGLQRRRCDPKDTLEL
jgi:CheY-like chemotaxis protein